MKKYFFLLLLIVFSAKVFSQKISLTGIIRDSIGSGVEMANIIAINSDTKIMESYCVTNHNGLYKLVLQENSNYNVKVSFIGFAPKEFVFNSKEVDAERNIRLSEENSMLSEVDVTYTMPVSVRGDTIVNDTDSFTTGTEKKLKDVLVSLAGV